MEADEIKELREQFEKQYKFDDEDLEKKFSRKDIVWAGFLAYHATQDNAHKSEFNNILQCELMYKQG